MRTIYLNNQEREIATLTAQQLGRLCLDRSTFIDRTRLVIERLRRDLRQLEDTADLSHFSPRSRRNHLRAQEAWIRAKREEIEHLEAEVSRREREIAEMRGELQLRGEIHGPRTGRE